MLGVTFALIRQPRSSALLLTYWQSFDSPVRGTARLKSAANRKNSAKVLRRNGDVKRIIVVENRGTFRLLIPSRPVILDR